MYTKQSTVGKCAWPTRFALVGGLHGAARFELHGAIMRDRAADQGGAIAASGDTHLDISRSTFVSNIAIVSSGGVDVSSGAADPMGGAISASGGTMSITSSEFTDNRAAKGGAIYTSGILTIVAAAFSGNKATVTALVHGGGAIVINGGTLSVTLSTFSNNQASGSSGTAFGGAIASISGGTVTITTTKFSGNRASGIHGGGGGAIYCGGGTLKLTNTTLSNNQAVAGLAIFAEEGASVELSNITVHPISQKGLYCNQKSTSLSSSSAVTTKTPMSCS